MALLFDQRVYENRRSPVKFVPLAFGPCAKVVRHDVQVKVVDHHPSPVTIQIEIWLQTTNFSTYGGFMQVFSTASLISEERTKLSTYTSAQQ